MKHQDDKCHVAIVGAGMAGSKLAYELAHSGEGSYQVTLIGEEPKLGYNRIMLSSLLANEISEPEMALVDVTAMSVAGVNMIANDAVISIETEQKYVLLQSGQKVCYDKLVIATGSRSTVLPIKGADAHSVIGFRNWQDVERMASLQGAQPVVVIGGGLLGLEAAVGLVKRGHQVTVFHRSNGLLNRQLDEASAALLQDKLERMGVRFRLGESPVEILKNSDDAVSHVRCANGNLLPAALVVMAAGITPEITLAKTAGIQTNRAICVNAQMQTSCEDVFAIGECCEFEQQTFGLVAPIWTQINVLLSVLADRTASFSIEPVPTKLKVSGVNLFSVGKIQPSENDTCIVFKDVGTNHYRKLLINGDQLVGAILYGNVADGSWYFQLIQNQTNVSEMLDRIIFGEAYCRQKVA